MPALEHKDRYQLALLFQPVSVDRFGQPVIGLPTEIRVRWVDKQSEMLDPQGNSVVMDATAVVFQDIPIGSRMWLGGLADWVGTGTGSGVTNEGLMEVKGFNKTSDVKNRYIRRTVGLMRFRDVPPS